MNFELHMRKGHRRDLTETCIKYFIQELGLTRSRYTLTVVTEPDFRREENAQGMVLRIDKRDVAMILDSRLNYKDLVETIAHEMVHVRQMARGTLNTTISRGRLYQTWRGRRMNKVAYHRRPWEVEAFQLERLLANNFVYDVLEKLK